MINLLIVDDEIFTREGLLEMIPFDKLNITNVRDAFDGVDALDVIKDFKPDILLTDVKMPRMNGVDLAFQIRKLYPECSIIFMSGYSDKEYLKSAIELKAVSYIEKPLEFDELENALSNAISENLKSKVLINDIENNITLKMTEENNIINLKALINSYISADMMDKLTDSNFLTLILKSENNIVSSSIMSQLKNIISFCDFNCFIGKKNDWEIIVHLFFPAGNRYNKISNSNFNSLFASIGDFLKEYCHYFIFAGKIIDSLDKVYLSFNSAKENMKYSFFYEYDSIIMPISESENIYTAEDSFFTEISSCLKDRDKHSLLLNIHKLSQEFKNNKNTSISYIKEVYYKTASKIIAYTKEHSFASKDAHYSSNTLEKILNSNNIYSIENLINELIEHVFKLMTETSCNTPINSILNYINEHYDDSDLCLEQISKNTFLTPAYICVIFKEHTSKTVNKYITEYRVEKAKEFLKDSNIKMNDVAEKVGYSDANYFSKIFRKYTAYTPSQYRRNFNK